MEDFHFTGAYSRYEAKAAETILMKLNGELAN